jgi:hypothetical protein
MRRLLLSVLLCISCDDTTSISTVDAGLADAGPPIVTYTNQAVDGSPVNAQLFAYQDGDGPWQVVAGAQGVYRLEVMSGRYAVVTACEDVRKGFARVDIDYFAVSDGATRYRLDGCNFGQRGPVLIAGTITHAPPDVDIQITDGTSAALIDGESWLELAYPGTGTLMGLVRPLGQAPTGIVLRNVDFAFGTPFEIDLAEAFAPAAEDLRIDLGGNGTVTTAYVDDTGRQHPIDEADEKAVRYHVVPAERLEGGISLIQTQAFGLSTVREVVRAFTNPVAQTIAMPDELALSAPPTIAATTPYRIIETKILGRAEASHYSVGYATTNGGTGGAMHVWRLIYSAAWAAHLPGGELVSRMPDLTSLAGWKPNFALAVATEQLWSVTVGTGPARLLPGASRHAYPGVALPELQPGDETSSASIFGDLR